MPALSHHAMTSPATQLHDVVVTNDQTRATLRARAACIRDGAIVVATARSARVPSAFFGVPTHTFTIVARDGGERLRTFASVTLERAAGAAGELVFR